MAGDTFYMSPKTTDAIDDFTVTVSRLFAAELSAEISTRFNTAQIERAVERTIERMHVARAREPLPIDELSFDAIQIAMDVANRRAAREAEEYGFQPAGLTG